MSKTYVHESRINICLHESAHSVARQLLLGGLGETGIKKRFAYSYPVVRRPLDEMGREELSKIAVIGAAGIVAEYELCGALRVATCLSGFFGCGEPIASILHEQQLRFSYRCPAGSGQDVDAWT